MNKNWRVYAQHIIETSAKISRNRSHGTLDEEIVYDAILRNLQTLAESTQRLPTELKSKHPSIPWRDISGFRNILVHNYLGDISHHAILEVLDDNLPELTKAVALMLADNIRTVD